jgi:hypothetical protein
MKTNEIVTLIDIMNICNTLMQQAKQHRGTGCLDGLSDNFIQLMKLQDRIDEIKCIEENSPLLAELRHQSTQLLQKEQNDRLAAKCLARDSQSTCKNI